MLLIELGVDLRRHRASILGVTLSNQPVKEVEVSLVLNELLEVHLRGDLARGRDTKWSGGESIRARPPTLLCLHIAMRRVLGMPYKPVIVCEERGRLDLESR